MFIFRRDSPMQHRPYACDGVYSLSIQQRSYQNEYTLVAQQRFMFTSVYYLCLWPLLHLLMSSRLRNVEKPAKRGDLRCIENGSFHMDTMEVISW